MSWRQTCDKGRDKGGKVIYGHCVTVVASRILEAELYESEVAVIPLGSRSAIACLTDSMALSREPAASEALAYASRAASA